MSFVHLHVHSHYSLLDGFGKPRDIVKKAKEQGSPAIALTDHGVMYGAVEFYKACEEFDIKPIIGCEVYVAPNSRFDKGPADSKPFHLTLLALNNTGYQNLLKLVTQANLEGFYYKPRIDIGLLKSHSEGLVALSGCLAGELARSVAQGKEDEPLQIIRKYQDALGAENFFLELQDHPLIDEQKVLNEKLIEIARAEGIPLVATQDSHYITPDDAKAQDILLCIQTQSTMQSENRMKFEGDFSLLPPDRMKEIFAHVPEAIENTLKIAERVDIKLDFDQDLIPRFGTPGGESARDYLRQLCDEGLGVRYGGAPTEEARKQLDYELGIVDSMGFNDYFLIVWDFVKFAKDRGITVGPGRGSAAGSLITYCLDITELNPLEYGLFFERFLNPERVSMPDIDIDFADTRRDEVLEYVREKYGRENVAQIITFGTMAARAAVRDTGRAMGFAYGDVDRIAKMVPPPLQGRHILLAESVRNDPELRKVYETEDASRELLDNAIKLEGTVRHAGTHASAVVMSEKPLVQYTPLQRATGVSEEIITQYSMQITEKIGLLKMDFLGLKNLTIIQNILNILKLSRGIQVDMGTIPMDDAGAFELLQKGDTTGIFQLESAGMRRYIRELKPTEFNDIIAMISLYRPGPMEWIPGYIKAKHNPQSIRYLHASFESILKETNGVAIYQEQILQIARDFAGFSLGGADILRKAVGKKNPKLLEEQKEKFIQGAVGNGHGAKFAAEVFEKVIEPFAGYGFNKAHAACYAMISYRTAYLKAHYPTEFMAALLSADADNTDRVVLEMHECEEMGIAVLPPSINESMSQFTVVNEGTIRFGLSAIKGLGEGTVVEILKARGDGRFASLIDVLQKVPAKLLNKKTLEALAYCGGLDDMGERKALANSIDAMSAYAKAAQEQSSQGQTNLFATADSGAAEIHFHLEKSKPATNMERLAWEKHYLGLYVSGHPLKGLRKYLSKKVTLIEMLGKKHIGKSVKLGGLLTKVKKVFTKAGSYMLYGELEDPTGRLEFVVFPKTYAQFHQFFEEGNVVFLEGRCEERRGALQFMCNAAKTVSLERMIENAKTEGLFDEKEKVARKQKMLELDVVEAAKVDTTTDGGQAPPLAASDPFNPETPFIIAVPESANRETLGSLKKLLMQHKGEQKVEIHVAAKGGAVKRIKIPFGVRVSEEFNGELKKVLA